MSELVAVAIGVFSLSIAIDIAMLFKRLWPARNYLSHLSGSLTAVGLGAIAATEISFFSLLVMLIGAFRLMHLFRIARHAMHHRQLYQLSKRSAVWLGTIQFASLALLGYATMIHISTMVLIVACLQLAIGLFFVGVVANSIHQTRFHGNRMYYADKDLPTITVAIPARNETTELKHCIDSVLSSNYPKLEVLVLDDCSQDKTADIIKQYAHAGVRFLKGTPPPKHWLAKNHAYEQLATAATGQYILFCGVDVRMSPSFLRDLVTHIKTKKKRMMSVLPIRFGTSLRSTLIQPMRYWWELAIPRKLINNPAVLSTAWIIDRKVLKRLGSFAAVKRSILPERYFARECVAHDTYAFIRADDHLDLKTSKEPSRQFQTAYRMRYPQFHRRIELILIYVLVLTFTFLLPMSLLVSSLLVASNLLLVISASTVATLVIAHTTIVNITHPGASFIALINLPLVITAEIAVAIYSMLEYEFGTVYWKGRNVCIPVMHQHAD